ncbi:peptidase S8/S53 domain-containing protein [Xylariaceae sp. AK1471]|nr:peptidase S8/S53 domain-containing protein [Xylariaceae sp. AK1471]
MSRYLSLNQSTNDFAYSELRPPSRGAPPDALDEAIMEENAREFYRFELALPAVSGVHDQLLRYASTHDSGERKQVSYHEDQVWRTVEKRLKAEVVYTGSKIQSDEDMDDPEAKVGRFVDSFATTGLPDPNLQLPLFPASVSEWVTEVTRKTGLNELMEWGMRKMFSTSPAEPPSSCNESEQQAGSSQAAEALYDFLLSQQCRTEKHTALLQLSGFSSSSQGNIAFHTFLSCSLHDKLGLETGDWHKTTCIYESSESPRSLENQINICDKIRFARMCQMPLGLSFNLRRLWVSRSTHRLLSTPEKTVKYVTLETLLDEGVLKTSDLGDNVKKFRLAVRLASSIHKLYSGPWMQQELSSENVQIVQNKDIKPIEMLDEAYVRCVISKDWRQPENYQALWQQHGSTEACPRFFLSLAQLLVDIVNGERDHPPFNEIEPTRWYDMLASEVRKNIGDGLMAKYWTAIENCLLYLAYDESESGRVPDKMQRAQEIIKEHIVRYLQDNLDFWEQQTLGHINELQSTNERSRYHGQTQSSKSSNPKQVAARQSPRNSAQPEWNSLQARQIIEPEFTLWSEKDEDWKILQKPVTQTPKHSFVSFMKMFLNTFIEPLAQPTGDSKVGRRVRVAIIDTGFYQDMSDAFLRPNVMKRIIDRRNFFSPNDADPDPEDWEDKHGHGTQVARLLLKYAPRAEILIAKISDSKSLKSTKKDNLLVSVEDILQALQWAVCKDADIINLSFGLGSKPDYSLAQEINKMVMNSKLIFAAASNTGQFGGRTWPATAPGVFAIHATNEYGTVDTDMSPEPHPHKDNFATYGCDIESYWKDHYRSISGTSFAAPIAAAIAANIVEFIRRQQPSIAEVFTNYRIMSGLFRRHMTVNSKDGKYHTFMPWAKGLWDEDNEIEDVGEKLYEIYTFE